MNWKEILYIFGWYERLSRSGSAIDVEHTQSAGALYKRCVRRMRDHVVSQVWWIIWRCIMPGHALASASASARSPYVRYKSDPLQTDARRRSVAPRSPRDPPPAAPLTFRRRCQNSPQIKTYGFVTPTVTKPVSHNTTLTNVITGYLMYYRMHHWTARKLTKYPTI